jgi:hypothetical protein
LINGVDLSIFSKALIAFYYFLDKFFDRMIYLSVFFFLLAFALAIFVFSVSSIGST